MLLWSEFASGGTTVHFSKRFKLDTKAKLSTVALLPDIILVSYFNNLSEIKAQ